MEIVVLGSGTAIPHPSRNPSGILLRAEGHHILIDSGPGTVHRLPRVGVPFQEIRHIFYTHLHLDHFLDLMTLLFAKRLPDIANAPRLSVRGGPGLSDLVERLRSLFHPWLEPSGYSLEVQEYQGPLEIEGLTIEACRLQHHPSSLAYRFEDKHGTSLVISGDTGEDNALEDLARDVSLLVLECSRPEGETVKDHLTPSQAGRLAQRADVQRLLLTHFYPACDGREIVGPCKVVFDGDVFLAHDWMHMKV